MGKISFNNYGPIVSTKESGNQILNEIRKSLGANQNVQLDLKAIRSMATFCAKQIFGQLYVELGAESFFDRIQILNASDDLKSIIKIGIQSAIEENTSKNMTSRL